VIPQRSTDTNTTTVAKYTFGPRKRSDNGVLRLRQRLRAQQKLSR
jgi:hypothetical protein